ncbi:MarR family transcriptional regulator [Desulfobacterales bacterium HSG17]|nr:MarR family transcriptional regulator [Desulfobacterales bacterium HSG17]
MKKTIEPSLLSPTKPLPDCTIFLLAKAYQKAHGQFKRQLKPYGLTNNQHLILEGLWYQNGQTAAELGKLLVLDKATLSGVLERLSNADWIDKRPDPEDRRNTRLYPSEKANKLKDELIELRKQANENLLSGYTLEEQVLFKRFLWDLM